MEVIALLVIGAAIMYAIMNTKDDLEKKQVTHEYLKIKSPIDSFVFYKKQIQQTSYYKDRDTYMILNEKLHVLICNFLQKHFPVILAEETWRKIEQDFEYYFEIEYKDWRIKKTLDIEILPNDILLALAISCYCHQQTYDNKVVLQNPFFTNRSIEYLITQKKYWPAQLAKALILKYGVLACTMPDVVKSANIFNVLTDKYRPAFSELEDIEKLQLLNDVKPVDALKSSGEFWDTYEEIEEKIKTWHPSNING